VLRQQRSVERFAHYHPLPPQQAVLSAHEMAGGGGGGGFMTKSSPNNCQYIAGWLPSEKQSAQHHLTQMTSTQEMLAIKCGVLEGDARVSYTLHRRVGVGSCKGRSVMRSGAQRTQLNCGNAMQIACMCWGVLKGETARGAQTSKSSRAPRTRPRPPRKQEHLPFSDGRAVVTVQHVMRSITGVRVSYTCSERCARTTAAARYKTATE
jgi:hypothetical protein